jgi:hypothetical protein
VDQSEVLERIALALARIAEALERQDRESTRKGREI